MLRGVGGDAGRGAAGAVAAAFVAVALSGCAAGPQPEGQDFLATAPALGEQAPGRGTAFASPRAKDKIYRKVAVIPFRAPVELAGASVADVFSTELLRTYKYELVERSQMEQVLGEQALGLQGVTESALAMRVGRLLNVQGVIVGTVPEYGLRAVGASELPAVGVNIRMIDVESGSIVWSVSDSAIATEPISISAFTRRLIQTIVVRLVQEWRRAGDTHAANLASPDVVSHRGAIRSATLEVLAASPQTYTGYALLRSRTQDGPYETVATKPNEGRGTIVFEDRNLLDAETYYYKVTGVAPSGLRAPPAGPLRITTTGPPARVREASAESGVARKVPLSWTPVDEPELKGYAVFRAPAAGGPWEEIQFVEGRGKTSLVDEGEARGFFSSGANLKDGTQYFYRVQAVNVVDVRGPFSPTVAATTKPVPDSVKGLRAARNEVKQVTLQWQPNPEPDITQYEIFRGGAPGSVTTKIATARNSDLRYVDQGLKDGASYYYRVRAVDKDQLLGEFSDVVDSATKPLPRQPRDVSGRFENGTIVLEWAPNPEGDIAHYAVFMKGFLLWDKLAETPDPRYAHAQEVKPGKTYTFRIQAVDRTELASEPSTEIGVTVP